MEGVAGLCPPFLPCVALDCCLGEAMSPPTFEFGESQSRELLCIFSGGSAREVASLGRNAPFAAVLEVICESRNGAGACWGQRTCKRAPASIA